MGLKRWLCFNRMVAEVIRSMAREKRIHQHRFVDRFPAFAAILLLFGGVAAVQGGGLLINVPPTIVTPEYASVDAIGYIIVSLIVLWIYKRWFYPEFEGNLRGGIPGAGIRLSLFILIYWAVCFPIQFLFTPAVFGWPTLKTLSLALTAGFTEEVAFRGLPVSLLMRQWHEEKRILTIMILISVIFGGVHITNFFAGANLGSTFMQTIGAACMGLFFCGIYLRCGNLWVPIAVHALHDYLCFLDVAGIQNGVVVQEITWFSFLDLAFSIGMGILGIWMVRPSKRAEIRRLWNRKWSITDTPSEPPIEVPVS